MITGKLTPSDFALSKREILISGDFICPTVTKAFEQRLTIDSKSLSVPKVAYPRRFLDDQNHLYR